MPPRHLSFAGEPSTYRPNYWQSASATETPSAINSTSTAPPSQNIRVDPDDLDGCRRPIDNATQHGAAPITIHVHSVSADAVEIRGRRPRSRVPRRLPPTRLRPFQPRRHRTHHRRHGSRTGHRQRPAQRNHGTTRAHNHPDGGADMAIKLRAIDYAADPRVSSDWQSQERLGGACPESRGILVTIHGELYAAAPTVSVSGLACPRRASTSWGICL